MVVNVDTDLLVSGGSGVLDSLSKCEGPYEAVANAQCGDVASFASFKEALNQKFDTFSEHSTIMGNRLQECGNCLDDVDNLIGNSADGNLVGADSLTFSKDGLVVAGINEDDASSDSEELDENSELDTYSSDLVVSSNLKPKNNSGIAHRGHSSSSGIGQNSANDFINAGKESGVSPVYLAALSKQEVSNGPTPGTAISGSYNGMYNFYNIGAYSGYNPAITGLEFAAFNDPNTRRPWNSEYKAIVGGALWMADKYISVGQNTSHFKRFNVLYNYLIELGEVKDPYANFQHQWMTNVLAPASEAISSYKSYYNSGLIDSSFVFYIPVYENMPDSTSLPDKQGWPNNYLSNITINSDAIAGFDGDIEEYNYYLDRNTKSINIKANPVNESAKIEGLGEFKIDKDTTKNIKVTAQNGNVKTYKINIILTGKEIENPIDIKTTLNNAGIKNNDSYLSGFVVGYDMQYIKDKIKNANKSAVVTLKNRNGEEKNSGFIATGDKVTITVSDETKEFEVVVYGDVNGDGMIKATDYVLIKNQIMGNSTLQGPYKEAADVDKNGMIKATDYVKIKNQIMGLGTIEQ